MRHHVVSSFSKVFVIALLGLLTFNASVSAQDVMVLQPQQYGSDLTEGGAVICGWYIYLGVQTDAAACGLPRQPIDDAVDEAIVAIEQFILDNSSSHPTRAMLNEYKRRQIAGHLGDVQRTGLEKACSAPYIQKFRSVSPDFIRAATKKLIAQPREPKLNPCL